MSQLINLYYNSIKSLINHRLHKKSICLNIGDEGVVLSHFEGKNLLERHFAKHSSPNDKKNLVDIVNNNSDAKIFILIDTLEQSFTVEEFPPVSKLSIKQLVKNKTYRDISNNLKGFHYINRNELMNDEWRYLIINANVDKNIEEWLNIASQDILRFGGIFSLPLEAASLIAQANKKIYEKQPPRWQIALFHNKSGGFRQIVLDNGKLFMSRLVNDEGSKDAEVTVGNIEQEILNTIEYLKRIIYKENERLEVVAIVGNDLKKHLQKVKLPVDNILIFSPHEMGEKIGLHNIVYQDDRFSDILCTGFFNKNKRKGTILSNKFFMETEIYRNIFQMVPAASLAIALLIGASIFSSAAKVAYDTSVSFGISNEISESNKFIEDVKKHPDFEYNQALLNLFSTYKAVYGETGASFYDYLSKTGAIVDEKISFQSVSWSQTEDNKKYSITVDASYPSSNLSYKRKDEINKSLEEKVKMIFKDAKVSTISQNNSVTLDSTETSSRITFQIEGNIN